MDEFLVPICKDFNYLSSLHVNPKCKQNIAISIKYVSSAIDMAINTLIDKHCQYPLDNNWVDENNCESVLVPLMDVYFVYMYVCIGCILILPCQGIKTENTVYG